MSTIANQQSPNALHHLRATSMPTYSDILSRHMSSAHGWRSTGRGRPPKAACKKCIEAKHACVSVASSRCQRCQEMDLACEYPARNGGGVPGVTSMSTATPTANSTATPTPTPTSTSAVSRDRKKHVLSSSNKAGNDQGGPSRDTISTTRSPQLVAALHTFDDPHTQMPTTMDPHNTAPLRSSMTSLNPNPNPNADPTTIAAARMSPHPEFNTTAELLLLADTAAQNRADYTDHLFMGMEIPSDLPDSIFDWGMTGWSVGDVFQPLSAQAPNTPSVQLFNSFPLPPKLTPQPISLTNYPGAPMQPNTTNRNTNINTNINSMNPVQQPHFNASSRSSNFADTPMSMASPISGIAYTSSSLEGVQPCEIPDGQPHDSPWPHVYKPRTGNTNIDLPPSDNFQSAQMLQAPYTLLPEANRQAMISLIRMSHHGSSWCAIDTTRFPSTTTLSLCVDLYFRHFHPGLPVLDPSTFDLTTAPPVLVMAVAAIGAMYSQDGLADLAIALNEIVRRSILFIREYDKRFMYETHLIQAWLLQAYFGTFCGSPDLYQHSEVSRGGLVTAARRMHLLRPGISAMEELRKRKLQVRPDEKVEAANEDDRRLRLGWGIYVSPIDGAQQFSGRVAPVDPHQLSSC